MQAAGGVDTCRSSSSAAAGESVAISGAIGLEVRTPVHILTAKELTAELKSGKLPRHMGTIPHLNIHVTPTSIDDCCSSETEKVPAGKWTS